MSAATESGSSRIHAASAPSAALRFALPWWPLLVVALFWGFYWGLEAFDLAVFTKFLWRAAALALLTFAFFGWWLATRTISWKTKMFAPAVTLLCAVVSTLLLHKTVMPPVVIILAWQGLITAWTIWLAVTSLAIINLRTLGLFFIAVAVWLPGMFVRMDAMRGDGSADFHARWTLSAEDKFLAELTSPPSSPAEPAGEEAITAEAPPPTIAAGEGDWLEFRGPNRDGSVRDVKIATNWSEKPPKLLWEKRVGPAWSSMVIVGDRLFTQEQRGDREAIICCNANSGEELWVHEDEARFEESLGGIGPRATPTFNNGRLYVQGASGILNCLDAATGSKVWSHDLVKETKATMPMWGYSVSPLVVGDKVIAFAGGESPNELLAYDAATGKLKWAVECGKQTYSSPQLVTLDGVPQVLMLVDRQLASFEAETGKKLWSVESGKQVGRPTVQPQLVGDSQVAYSFVPDDGVSLVTVNRDGDKWNVKEEWASRDLKPDFNDFVQHDGHLYGFDGTIFCCIDLEDGKRQWKKGRYGAGQALMLADQPLVLVITETGDIVLVEANPEKHRELAQFPAGIGKTWNHPVIAKGKLFVRSNEKMACYELDVVE